MLGVTRYVILLLLWQLSNITKYAIKTGNITQVTLLTNVTRYLSNIVSTYLSNHVLWLLVVLSIQVIELHLVDAGSIAINYIFWQVVRLFNHVIRCT